MFTTQRNLPETKKREEEIIVIFEKVDHLSIYMHPNGMFNTIEVSFGKLTENINLENLLSEVGCGIQKFTIIFDSSTKEMFLQHLAKILQKKLDIYTIGPKGDYRFEYNIDKNGKENNDDCYH